MVTCMLWCVTCYGTHVACYGVSHIMVCHVVWYDAWYAWYMVFADAKSNYKGPAIPLAIPNQWLLKLLFAIVFNIQVMLPPTLKER